MTNYRCGNEFDLLPGALFIPWWREDAGLPFHWARRLWAEYWPQVCSCAREEGNRLYAGNSLSEVAGKLLDGGSISVTTAKIFILEMIKAVLKAEHVLHQR